MFDVAFSPDRGFAYRPRQILLPTSWIGLADDTLSHSPLDAHLPEGEEFVEGWSRFDGVDRVLDAVEILRRRGIPAQPNHVLFATCGCGCGCGPHPADPSANPYYANPYYANPYYANPYYANPYYANPYYANPYYANPYYANPYHANPTAANPNPGLSGAAESDAESRRSSARPAKAPEGFTTAKDSGQVRVTVLDTGFAAEGFAAVPLSVNDDSDRFDVPDTAEDQPLGQTPQDAGNGILDPAAGHGTFIAGVIRQFTDGDDTVVCDITVKRVLTTFGVGDEATIAAELAGLRADGQRETDFVNLSFGGYSPFGMRPLAEEIERLIEVGVVVVASAGNDATCVPMYPAAIPGVIGVAALDEHDMPAPFTNFGPWVRACTLGVDVVSTFFEWNGDEQAKDPSDPDPDDFDGWAQWSGTSFAAPRVVAALAKEYARQRENDANADPYFAVKTLIDDPDNVRLPMLGTLVAASDEQNPWDWVKIATKKESSPQQP